MSILKPIPAVRILADDVTGAADCAARCKGAGLPATILVQPSAEALPDGAISLSSDSRYLAPTVAADHVQRLYRELREAETGLSPVTWYKKIDSTLRGNIGAELAAMLALTTPSTVRPCTVVTSAFPAQGRGLVDGSLVYGQASDQRGHLPSLIRQQSVLPLATVGLASVRAGVTVLASRLMECYNAGAQFLVADAVTEADLATIYQATVRALPHALFCGSAGLIGVIASALVEAQGTIAPPLTASSLQLDHPLLAVVGSGSVMAQRQVAQLQLRTDIDRYEVALHQTQGEGLLGEEANHRDCLLHLPPPAPDAPLEGAVARQYAAALSAVARHQIQQRRPRTLLLVGGDTATHLLQLLGIKALQVQAELLPGMPLTIGQAADGQLYQIILKAGNHGDEQTLARLFE